MAKPQATPSILNDPCDDVERCLSAACCLIATAASRPQRVERIAKGSFVPPGTTSTGIFAFLADFKLLKNRDNSQGILAITHLTISKHGLVAHAGDALFFNAEGRRQRKVRQACVSLVITLSGRQVNQHAVRIPNNKA